MFELFNQFELSMSRDRIWRVLDDLPKYRDWHPTIFFTGTASHNAVVEYGFNGTVASLREPSAPARIVSYDPGEMIGWRLGVPALMWADEWYRLTAVGTVTRVEHGLRCSGPVSWLMKSLVSKRVRPLLEAADDALAVRARSLSQLCPHCGRTHPMTRNQRRKNR